MADNDSRAGHGYADPEILAYVEKVHVPHDAALSRAFDAPGREEMPAIQVGASEGKLLELLVRLVNGRKVVEIGTLAGYSALFLARALPADGHLFSIEKDPRHAEVAREIMAFAGLEERVTIVEGDAAEALRGLEEEGPFCAVFVDADKGRYDLYGRWARENLREGGLLIGDNAYLFGHLLEADHEAAPAMRRFHEEMAESFRSVCIPTPDGLALGIKLTSST